MIARRVHEVAGLEPVDHAADAVEDPKVAVHPVGDVRALDLEHRVAAVEQHAAVHLGDRRSRQRHRPRTT